MIFNGFTYAILGIPSRDLEKPWYDVTEIPQSSHSSTLLDRQTVATVSHVSFSEVRRIRSETLTKLILSQQHAFGGNPTIQAPRRKLYTCGRILHIVRKKKKDMEKGSLGPNYEMRWASPEDFLELKVMPRMILDHFPQNIMKVLTSVLKERKNDSTLSVEKI